MLTIVTGLNGAGKTAYAVGMLDAYRRRGIRVVANIGVKGADVVRSFDELMMLRDCVLLLDEATAMISSRQSQSLAPEALLFFQTLRHSNIGCIVTAPTIDRVDIALRSLLLKWVALTPIVKTVPRGGIWANTHLSLVRTGRPLEGADGAGAKMAAPWFSLYRPSRHHAAYDSYADVDLFTRQTRFPRTCPRCGLGVTYGAKAVSDVGERDPDDFQAAYFCANCGHLLGAVTRQRSIAPTVDRMGAEEFARLVSGEVNATTVELRDDSLQSDHLRNDPPGLGATSSAMLEESRGSGNL